MSNTLTAVAIWLALVVCASTAAYAQNHPAVTVRQGDTIQWVVASAPPHKVKFGPTGTTPVADLKDIFDSITPALTPAGESPQAASGTLLTAVVKDTATPGKTFVFTCGVHPAQMMSLPFVVAAKVAGEPARTYKIVGEPGLHWHVHVDTTP